MKKTNLIYRLILGATLVLSIVSCNKSLKKTSSGEGADSLPSAGKTDKIAYVEIDSIFKYYDMAKDINATFDAKQKRLDADLSEKSKTLQENAAEFQNKVQKGLITQSNAQEVQNQLAAQEQGLYQLRDQYRSQLADETQVNQRQIIQSIMDYLKEYNKDKGYRYILANTFPSTILFADSTLNITKEVVEGLNARYKKNKPKK